MAELKTRIVLRNDSKTNWEAANTAKLADNGPGLILLKGEIGIEFNPAPAKGQTSIPEIKIKIGDGFTRWDALPYATKTPAEIDSLIASITAKLGNIPTKTDESGEIVPVAENIIEYINLKTDGIATDENLELLSERVKDLEEIEHHTHTNKDELDKISDGDVAKWDAAAEQIENLVIPTGSTVYQNTDLANIAKDELNNGDFAIITSVISGDKVSRTAYVWDSSIEVEITDEAGTVTGTSYGDWVAFDGNYSADNVYFEKDFTFTKAIGTVATIPSSGSTTKTAAGKNLTEFFASLFAEEAWGVVTNNPGATLTVGVSSNGSTSGEVGTSFNPPYATLALDAEGDYTYDAKDANGNKYSTVKLSFNTAKVSFKSHGENAYRDTAIIDIASDTTTKSSASYSETVTISGLSADTLTFTDSTKKFTFKAEAKSDADTCRALSNLGNFEKKNADNTYTSEGITYATANVYIGNKTLLNGTDTNSVKTVSYTGYRKPFWQFIAYNDEHILDGILDDSGNIVPNNVKTALTNWVSADGTKTGASAWARSLSGKGTKADGFSNYDGKFNAGIKQIVYLAKAGVYASVDAKDGFKAPVTFTKIANALKVEGANGATAVDYDLWIYALPATNGAGADSDLVMTWTKA